MRQYYWEFRGLGFEMVAAANDTPETNAELRERLDLPFMLLSDPGGEVARAYDAFHENEPKGRDIARVSVFLIDSSENDQIIRWEYVSPTHHHRVPPSMLIEEMLNMKEQQHQVVSVLVPSEAESFDEDSSAQIYKSEIAMGAYTELHRLAEEGWNLIAVTPELNGHHALGQRYVFERHLE